MTDTNGDGAAGKAPNFIRDSIADDIRNARFEGVVVTRFPPEPNGYLHIGHAKAIAINFGLAQEFGGRCHLRFDDTNPSKEENEYIRAIQEDVRWLGYDWGEHCYFASDYFESMYEHAIRLIKDGRAYVDDLDAEQIREYRGTLTQPGRESPYRNRSCEENLALFQQMRKGVFASGEKVLRARIDMASPNINLRDPVMYRILTMPHHRQGDTWCIYPMYDWAHGLEDSIEGVTHSLCSLEFEDHRPLYDWFLARLPVHRPRQIEFARLNLTYTVMSKRKLLRLVQERLVEGWDDPRMPTLSGMRRRGYPPQALRMLCERIGVAKRDSIVDFALLEFCVREVLNKTAPRFMGVLDPLKVVLENYPQEQVEECAAVNNPEDPDAGTRLVPFSRELFIERGDFMEEPPKKFYRLAPGREVRLRYAYYITCTSVIRDNDGRIIELRCTYDPLSRGGSTPDGRRVRSTIHWVSAAHAIAARVRLYDKLFTKENLADVAPGGDFTDALNPDSLRLLNECVVEPAVAALEPGQTVQFERLGYFCIDAQSTPDNPLLNRTVTLRDDWARELKNRRG